MVVAQGAEVVSGHWTALHRWVWHDCQVHFNLSAGLVVIWMQVKLPSGTGAVTDTMFPLSLIKARMQEAVPWTAFCIFLQRWCIFGFGLQLGKLLVPGPAFAAVCPMQMGEASWEAVIMSRLAAAVCCPVHP